MKKFSAIIYRAVLKPRYQNYIPAELCPLLRLSCVACVFHGQQMDYRSVCVCIYIYIYIYIYMVRVRAHTHTHTHTYIYIYIYSVCACAHTHTHTHIYIYIYKVF